MRKATTNDREERESQSAGESCVERRRTFSPDRTTQITAA